MRGARGISRTEKKGNRRHHAAATPEEAGCNGNKRWSPSELEQLEALRHQGHADVEIARRLGRSQRAVRTAILRLGGPHLREATRPWAPAEEELALALHAGGTGCAAIAEALPGRTELAVFRKLRHLVGAAPFSTARRAQPAPAEPQPFAPTPDAVPLPELVAPSADPVAGPVAPPVAAPAAALPVAANQPGRAPWQPGDGRSLSRAPASLDTIVRWLRSRDFVVLKKKVGWRVDQHELKSDLALLDFVNVRRQRLRMPVFLLVEDEPASAAFDIAG